MATAIDKSLGLITQAKLSSISKIAVTLAAKLGEDDGLSKSIDNAVLHANENKKSVNAIHFSVLELMDCDPDTLECEEMDAWPVPGSKKKDVGDNGAFDRFEYKDSNGNVKKDSFYAIVLREMPVGQQILARKKAIDDGFNPNSNVKNKYSGITEGEMKRAKKDVDSEFTTVSGKLRMAVGAYFHIKAMRDAFPKVVTVDYAKNDKGAIDLSSPNIICIRNKLKPEQCVYFTIPNFLRLSIAKAIADGGTYVDIIKANARETPEDENPDATKHISISSVKEFEDASIAFYNFMKHKFSSTPGTKELLGHFRGAGSDDRLMTMFDLAEQLTHITENPELKARYEALASNTEVPDKVKEAA